MGARSSEQWREHRALLEAIQRGDHVAPPHPEEPEPVAAGTIDRGVTIAIALLAVLWLAALAASFRVEASPLSAWAGRISLASAPLALLAMLWLLSQRSSRSEANRFARTAAAMRAESAALEQSLAGLTRRIEEGRASLGQQANELLLLGEDSALRLAEIEVAMNAGTRALGEQAERLETASHHARTDMGVMMADMPQAEQQMRGLAAQLRSAGLDAQTQASGLEAQLAALTTRSREAEKSASAAAERLTSHIARIESSAQAAGECAERAGRLMETTLDAALGRASNAIESGRASLDAQRDALSLLVSQGVASLDRAGEASARALQARLDAVGAELDRLTTRLARQEEAGERLLAGLRDGLVQAEERFAALERDGGGRTTKLTLGLRALGEDTSRMTDALASGAAAADRLVSRTQAIREEAQTCTAAFDGQLPDLFARIEAAAGRARAALAEGAPDAERMTATLDRAAARAAEIAAAVAKQEVTLRAIGEGAEERLAALRTQAEALHRAIDGASNGAKLLTEGAGQQLIEALLRVRETAQQAAERARAALSAVIPEAAASLGASAETVLVRTLGDKVEERIAAVSTASEGALAAVQRASERLGLEVAAMSETSEVMNARLAKARDALSETEQDQLSAHAATLIESLNSLSIDVATIVSQDVGDVEWAAYLKGDRGVFTRRAARLIGGMDGRAVLRLYEEDGGFRDVVNRYIHDFEAMLRRVLAARNGQPLAVTLLSSDMGKLYVAVAKAIERLRT